MKFLDERGRIAGLINIFDLLILMGVAFLAFYYWVEVPRLLHPPAKGLAAPPARSAKEMPAGLIRKQPGILEELYLVFKDVEPQVASLIRPGDRDTTHPKTRVEVTEILGIEPMRNLIELGGRKALASVPGEKLLVQAKVRIEGIMEGQDFWYKDQPLLHGQTYSFITEKYSLMGELYRIHDTFVQGRMPVKRRIRVTGLFTGLPEEFAAIIQPGNEAIYTLRDPPKGETTLVIREVLREPAWPAERASLRKVKAVLECLCQHDELGYSFSGNYIRVGTSLPFTTELYTFNLQIHGIEVLGPSVGGPPPLRKP